MLVRDNDIIFLLGAGASADAGIPILSEMEKKVCEFIANDDDWKNFYQLYHLIRASYNYSYQIQGKESYFNLEILLNIIQELLKKEEHLLYPFIGSWIVKFDEVIKDEFNLIESFDKKIRSTLLEWVKVDNNKRQRIDYFRSFLKFKNEMNFPLHIFTLNYDLCLELALADAKVERGFDTEDSGFWNYRRFLEPEENIDIFLYKLHGSVDWERDEQTKRLTYSNGVSSNPDLIFGTQYKMQYIDPYLFLFSEFRRRIFESKMIVSIGYGFYDEHINGVISDSLRNNQERKLLSVSLNLSEDEIKSRPNIDKQIAKQIIIISNKKAKDFLESDLNMDYLNQYLKNEEDI